MNNKLTYTGIIPPIVTPLTPQEELDSDALQKLISFDIENGVSGIFVNGTSGEALRLPDHVWQETMRTALAASFGRIPVFCGAIDTSASRVIERLKTIEECGGKIAVCTPPFYLTSFGQDEILRHYDAICRSTDLEIAVYNIPETTHANILPETISRLAEYDSIVAYKDSTADWQQLQRAMILLKDKDIAVLNGAEELCCVSMLWGAGGCIPGLANFVPGLFVQLQNSCRAGCLEKARQLQEQINAIRKAIFVSGCWMAGMKGILELFGLGSRTVSQPLQAVTESQLDEIRRILTSGGVSLA
ncbi:MAG: dihydrodipicolinate synthase family protein [Lachnospiraceae bacterium]|nr:dihydrodipicolinate synthase family protein [Lachnospiraceae bacterium]